MAARTREPRIYVDTSAFIAFLDRSDTYHALFRQLFGQAHDLLTTVLVVAEGHGWFLRRYDRTRALQFMAMIEDMAPLAIVPAGDAELAGAAKVLRKFSDQDLTLVDAMGLYVMQAQRIKQCWSTDFHLRLSGATLAIDAA
jgi:predicted nucleic acid-binding protein